jgi:hypothetical protein
MRKMMLLAAMVAIAALMLAAAPAFAAEDHPGGGPCSGGSNRDEPCGNPVPGCKNEGAAEHNPHCIPENNDNNNGNDNDNNNNNNNNNNNRFCHFFDCNNFVFVPQFAPEISQENEQEAESGDVNQSFNVTGGGDNSNQCVGGQQVANTGNAQNQISVLDVGGFDGNNNNRFFDHRRFDNRFFDNEFNGGDVEFDDTGASIDVSPTNTTSCDQQVNQAASATG